MTEYNCYAYALEIGFTKEEAQALQSSKCGKGQDATVLRRLAKAKNLPSTRPPLPVIKLELSPNTPQATPTLAKPTVGGKLPTKRRRATRTKSKSK